VIGKRETTEGRGGLMREIDRKPQRERSNRNEVKSILNKVRSVFHCMRWGINKKLYRQYIRRGWVFKLKDQ